ncbi:MAG: hypothetical protein ACFFG0_12275 [Candidatus Thorarchaeota archaeon]
MTSENKKDKVYTAYITLGIRKDGSVEGVYEEMVLFNMDKNNFMNDLSKYTLELFDKLEVKYNEEVK